MKRIILSLLLISSLYLVVSAQKTVAPNAKSGSFSNQSVLNATDTLYGSFFDGSPALYRSQSVFPGFASGNNAFGDLAKAQVFSLDTISAVQGVIIWFGYKNQTSEDVNSKINVNLYNLNATATGQGAFALKLCPDSIYRSTPLLLNSIDTSSVFELGLNVVNFNSPAYFDTLFSIGFDFNGLAIGDTVACFTNTDGDADSTENAWELTADSVWSTMLNNWGLNVDYAIFPIIDGTLTGMHTNNATLPAAKLYPNPGQAILNIELPFETKNEFSYVIVTADGKVLTAGQLNSKTTEINTSHIASGVYFVVLRDKNGKGYAQKWVVE